MVNSRIVWNIFYKGVPLPKTLNALMKHLRSSGININGSSQKRKLKNMGYYHGYKGLRFVKTAENKLPLSNFSEVVALHDFDMQLKSLLYPRMMLVEGALKNYTLEAVLTDANSNNFEVIWQRSLTDYKSKTGKSYREAWGKRQRLRNEIDGAIYRNHNNRDVIRHFRDTDKEIPIWAIFEVITLGNFGSFYDCLAKRVQTAITKDIGMPTNLESELYLKNIIFALKDLRNAIAHNGFVLDARFKSGSINSGVSRLLQQETGITGINFDDITDYVVLLTYLMRCMGFSKTECRQFLAAYETTLERFRSELPFNIYSKLVRTNAKNKLAYLRTYIRK